MFLLRCLGRLQATTTLQGLTLHFSFLCLSIYSNSSKVSDPIYTNTCTLITFNSQITSRELSPHNSSEQCIATEEQVRDCFLELNGSVLSRKLQKNDRGVKIVTQLCKKLVLANTSSMIWCITVRPSERSTAYRCERMSLIKDRKSFLQHLGRIHQLGRVPIEIMIWGILGNVVYSAEPFHWQTQALFVIRLHSPEVRRLSRYFVKSLQVVRVCTHMRTMWQKIIFSTAVHYRDVNFWNALVWIRVILFLTCLGYFISTGIPDNCVTRSQISLILCRVCFNKVLDYIPDYV